jgi:hypothetical protein
MDTTLIFTDIIVPIVAVFGFVLSVYNTFRHWKENRPNIFLEFSYQDTDFDPVYGDFPLQCYILLVKNLGNVNLIIDFAGFKWGNQEYKRESYGNTLTEQYRNFPHKLTPGSTLSIEFPQNEIKEEILKTQLKGAVKVTGFIKGGDGKYYKSPPLMIDLK